MHEINAHKLGDIIDQENESASDRAFFRDVFAVACYLNQQGNRDAASKLCGGLFNRLGRDRRKTYFSALMQELDKNEEHLASEICAHAEINKLFRN